MADTLQYEINEGSSGIFAFARGDGQKKIMSTEYSIIGGTAVQGVDYTFDLPLNGSVTTLFFDSIPIITNNDSIYTGDRTIIYSLKTEYDGKKDNFIATMKIVEDELPCAIRESSGVLRGVYTDLQGLHAAHGASMAAVAAMQSQIGLIRDQIFVLEDQLQAIKDGALIDVAKVVGGVVTSTMAALGSALAATLDGIVLGDGFSSAIQEGLRRAGTDNPAASEIGWVSDIANEIAANHTSDALETASIVAPIALLLIGAIGTIGTLYTGLSKAEAGILIVSEIDNLRQLKDALIDEMLDEKELAQRILNCEENFTTGTNLKEQFTALSTETPVSSKIVLSNVQDIVYSTEDLISQKLISGRIDISTDTYYEASDTVVVLHMKDVEYVVSNNAILEFEASTNMTHIIGGASRNYIDFRDAKVTDVFISYENSLAIVDNKKVALTDIEGLIYDDGVLRTDIDGIAGQGYRIYQAAFDRTPDTEGLSYWVNQMDQGMSFGVVANAFIDSPEFSNVYGTLDNRKFVNQLYVNVLDRLGESSGVDYWVGNLNGGRLTRGEVLAGFSESPENILGVAAKIENGIWLI